MNTLTRRAANVACLALALCAACAGHRGEEGPLRGTAPSQIGCDAQPKKPQLARLKRASKEDLFPANRAEWSLRTPSIPKGRKVVFFEARARAANQGADWACNSDLGLEWCDCPPPLPGNPIRPCNRAPDGKPRPVPTVWIDCFDVWRDGNGDTVVSATFHHAKTAAPHEVSIVAYYE